MLFLPMDVKKIFEKIHRHEEEKPETFLSLKIEENSVKGAVWAVKENKVIILKIGEKYVWNTEEEILTVLDNFFLSLQPSLPTKVIFGIVPSWVEKETVISSKSQLLKNICQEFNLTAIGFVIIPEAIVYFLKKREGTPPTVVLVNLGEKRIILSLVKLGKIVATETIIRSDDLGADFLEGLSRFPFTEAIPPRIILYGEEKEVEKGKEDLMSFSWEQLKVNFPHIPKIEILPRNFDIFSISLAGARELMKGEEVEGVEIIEETPPEEKRFLAEEEEEEETSLKISQPQAPEEKELESLGFVMDKDVTQEVSSVSSPSPSRKINLPKINFAPLLSIFSRITVSLSKFFSPFLATIFSGGKKILIGLIMFLIILGGVLFLLWWYLPKAEITLWVKSDILQKELTITLDPKLTTVDKEKLIFPAETIEEIIEGEKNTPATGIKLIGEPARGEVVIYNSTLSEKTFDEGTIFIGPQGIKFTLEEKVTVASRSGTAAEPIPGKSRGKLKAVEIGAQGNLAAGTEFVIGNFSKSDFVAKNEEDFSGGTSREITVVSKKDQEKLLGELERELKEKIIEKLREKVSSGKIMIEESVTTKILEKKFDKEIEEEGDTLHLKLKIEAKALSFSEEELRKLMEEEISKIIPEGFEYRPEESEFAFEVKKTPKEEGGVSLIVHLKAHLISHLDIEAIKGNLLGKSPSIVQSYLGTFPGIERFEVKITPHFPSKIVTLPRVSKNIKIKVEVEKK